MTGVGGDPEDWRGGIWEPGRNGTALWYAPRGSGSNPGASATGVWHGAGLLFYISRACKSGSAGVTAGGPGAIPVGQIWRGWCEWSSSSPQKDVRFVLAPPHPCSTDLGRGWPHNRPATLVRASADVWDETAKGSCAGGDDRDRPVTAGKDRQLNAMYHGCTTTGDSRQARPGGALVGRVTAGKTDISWDGLRTRLRPGSQ